MKSLWDNFLYMKSMKSSTISYKQSLQNKGGVKLYTNGYFALGYFVFALDISHLVILCCYGWLAFDYFVMIALDFLALLFCPVFFTF